MKKILTMACLSALLLTTACQFGPAPLVTQTATGLPQQPTETQPAPTETAIPTGTSPPPTPSPAPTDTPLPTAAAGTVVPPPVQESGVLSPDDFSIGTVAGVADSWFVTQVNGVPYVPNTPPPLKGWPPHLFVTFEEEGRPEADPENFVVTAPQGRVFPVEAWRSMFAGSEQEFVAHSIDELERILTDRPETITGTIPVLPDVGATQDLRAKITYIDFSGGSGIGFVGHYAQGPEPITNQNLAYFFQGLTSDGQHYLSFVQPLSTNFLPENRDEVPQETLDQLGTDPLAYMQDVTQAIEQAKNSDFTPSLEALIAMYRSIVIGAPGTGTPAAGTPTTAASTAGALTATSGAPRATASPTAAAPGLTGILWAWQELREAGNDNVVVTEPMSYTLSLASDGSLSAKADCNQAGGRYTLGAGGAITITISTTTRAACPQGSMSQEYLAKLEMAEVYSVSGGQLLLELAEGEGEMVFSAGQRQIEITAEPAEGAATATTRDVVNILSGPGSQYPSYGTVPAGTVLEVTGRSADSAWWVVKLPPEIAAEGQGWVAARYVEAKNTEDVPVVQPPPAP